MDFFTSKLVELYKPLGLEGLCLKSPSELNQFTLEIPNLWHSPFGNAH